MINITKAEKNYLLKKGYRYHKDVFSSATKRHFYAREDKRILEELRKYRTATTR